MAGFSADPQRGRGSGAERWERTVTETHEEGSAAASITLEPIAVVRDAPDDLERADWSEVESTIQLSQSFKLE